MYLTPSPEDSALDRDTRVSGYISTSVNNRTNTTVRRRLFDRESREGEVIYEGSEINIMLIDGVYNWMFLNLDDEDNSYFEYDYITSNSTRTGLHRMYMRRRPSFNACWKAAMRRAHLETPHAGAPAA
jgi:hypothetical protein